MFNINSGLCVFTSRVNCSFYVKYYTALHGFARILAKKLAPTKIKIEVYRLTYLIISWSPFWMIHCCQIWIRSLIP